MKSFLLKQKTPILKWGMIPDNIFFEGDVPDGYSLAISPSDNYIIVDVDNHKVNGFENIPEYIQEELNKTLNYPTKNNGRHYWLQYTGNEHLKNKSTKLGIDLRTKSGYVVWYLDKDIRAYQDKIKTTSTILNNWLEKLFK